MNLRQWLILLWFCSMVGFFSANIITFIVMAFNETHQATVQEPSNVIFWTEFGIMILTLIMTFWLLHQYVERGSYLDLRER